MTRISRALYGPPRPRRGGGLALPVGLGILVFLVLTAVTIGTLLHSPASVGARSGPPTTRLIPTATPEPAAATTPSPLDPGSNPLYEVELVETSCADVRLRRTTVPPAELEPYLESLVDCLVQVHAEPLATAGLTLSPPRLQPQSELDSSGCTMAKDEPDDWAALYCGTNRTIYYRTDWDPAEPLHHVEVMAHEFAHHLQQEAGILQAVGAMQRDAGGQPGGQIRIQDASRRLELQAECLSGMMVGPDGPLAVRPAELAGLVDARASVPPDWAATHGTGRAQTRWFTAGSEAFGELATCNTFSAPAHLVE